MGKSLLKVLIVDDEEIVRRGLKNIIDWESLGCTVCSEASTAEEALEKISTLMPSIVMLDINMPGMTGIDLLAEVNHDHKKYQVIPKFVILSGYSDFEYAQKAINYGAKGYLVKPVDEDLLEEKIRSLVAEICIENEDIFLRSSAQEEKLSRQFSQMFLFGAVEDAFAPEEDTSDRYKVAIISPELCGCAGQYQMLKNAIHEFFKFMDFMAFSMDPNYVIVFKNESEESVQRHMERFCNRMHKEKMGSLVALGKTAAGLQGALDSYQEACTVFSQLFFFQEKYFITMEDVENDRDSMYRLEKSNIKINVNKFFDCIGELIQYIEIYDLQKIDEILHEQEQWLHSTKISVEQMKKLCMAFIVDTQNAIHSKHPEKELDTVSALDLVNLIYTQNYFSDVICIVHDFIFGIAENFTQNSSSSTIMKVIQYVRSNYNTDLKLEMLGNLFNCNSAYLGKKFKEYTGVAFNTYMDIIRIDQAKEMILNSDLKIYEISKLVGYSNTDYFYLKFKKHTNMTPKEFQKSGGKSVSDDE